MEVTARIPASIANLGPSFDVHSIALQKPSIEVTLTKATTGSLTIHVTGKFSQEVTTNPKLHAGAKALSELHHRLGIPDSMTLDVRADIPPRKGLGFSGAEAVGAVLCANRLFKLGLDMPDVARIAATAEPSHHLDNAAASALGGFNIISKAPAKEQQITTYRPPVDLGIAVVVPDIDKVSTEATRQALPEKISREQYVNAMGYVSKISAAFAAHNTRGIIEALPWDPTFEPARADAGYYGKGVTAEFLQVEKRTLMERFHVAETISGAGPSRALWYSISEDRAFRRKKEAGLIANAIQVVSTGLRSFGHDVQEVFLTRPSVEGATIISRKRRK
jgi:homoserine kinase